MLGTCQNQINKYRKVESMKIPVFNDEVQYSDYKDDIDNLIDEIGTQLSSIMKPELIKDTFWKIVNGQLKESELSTQTYLLMNCIFLKVNLGIQVVQKRIPAYMVHLFDNYLKYLADQFFTPFFNDLSPDFKFNVPRLFPGDKQLESMYKVLNTREITQLIKKSVDTGVSIAAFLPDLDVELKNLYNIIEKYTLILGEEIGRIEGKQYTNYNDVFQLRYNSKDDTSRTPRKYQHGSSGENLNDLLLEFKIIKNAIGSHSSYEIIDEDRVKIIDVDTKKSTRGSKIYTKKDLFLKYFELSLLVQAIVCVSSYFLAIAIQKHKNLAKK